MFRQIIFSVLFLTGVCVSAKTIEPSGVKFIEEGEQGWFWYEREPEEPPEPEEEIPNPVISPSPEQTPEPAEPSRPEPLSSAWFRANLQGFMDRAIDSGDVDDAKTYLYLQRIAMDKSEMFAENYLKATLGNPHLDENNRSTTNPAGSNIRKRIASENFYELSDSLKDDVAILFFYKAVDACEMCLPQYTAIQTFASRTDMSVIPISADGSDIADYYGRRKADFLSPMRLDQGHAERIGVTDYPALVLVNPKKQTHQILSQSGPLIAKQFETRFMRGLLVMGEVDESAYRQTKLVTKPLIDLDLEDVAQFESLEEDKQLHLLESLFEEQAHD